MQKAGAIACLALGFCGNLASDPWRLRHASHLICDWHLLYPLPKSSRDAPCRNAFATPLHQSLKHLLSTVLGCGSNVPPTFHVTTLFPRPPAKPYAYTRHQPSVTRRFLLPNRRKPQTGTLPPVHFAPLHRLSTCFRVVVARFRILRG